MELDEHFTIKQVAKAVKVDRRTIHRWIQKGKLRAIRIPGRRGGEWRISMESLRELGLEMTNGNERTYKYEVPKSFCPYCFSEVLPTPIGYLCKVHKDLTILQVISERIAELRRKKRDEREQEV